MPDSRCGYCRIAVRWVDAPWGGRMPLNTVPAPPDHPQRRELARLARYVVVKGTPWEPWQLTAMGEPWCDFADAPAYTDHRRTCRNKPGRQAPKPRPTAQGHSACQVCGSIEHRVRRYPWGYRCLDHIGVR